MTLLIILLSFCLLLHLSGEIPPIHRLLPHIQATGHCCRKVIQLSKMVPLKGHSLWNSSVLPRFSGQRCLPPQTVFLLPNLHALLSSTSRHSVPQLETSSAYCYSSPCLPPSPALSTCAWDPAPCLAREPGAHPFPTWIPCSVPEPSHPHLIMI